MRRKVLLSFLWFFDLAAAQIHLGPIGNQQAPVCYNCDRTNHHFPTCVNGQITCHLDEVCSVSYGNGLPTFKCQNINTCSKDVSNPLGNCTGGGVQVQQNLCELCCHTSECVLAIRDALLQEFPLHVPYHGLFCPGRCLEVDLKTCVDTGVYCHDGQFCKVGIDDHLMVQGHCTDNKDIQKCFDDQFNHPCVLPVGQAGHMTKCVWDCCPTSSCLISHIGVHLNGSIISQTTQPPTPTPTQPPTPAPTQPPTAKSTQCYHCDGDVCHHNEKNVTCPGDFCMMTVDEESTGSRFVNKRCAEEIECYQAWYEGWRTDQLCGQYLTTPSKLSGRDMSCKFCCMGDYCNGLIDISNVHQFQ